MNAPIDASPSAEILYDDLFRQAKHPARRRSLEAVKAACDLLEKQGVKISPAAVGEQTRLMACGLRTQSLRNSKELSRYIAVRRDEQSSTLSARKVKSERPANYLSADERANAEMRLLRIRCVAFEERYHNIRRFLRNVPNFDLEHFEATGKLVLQKEVSAPDQLSMGLVTALQHLLDEERLNSCSLAVVSGRLKSGLNAATLLEKDDLAAIRDALIQGNHENGPPRNNFVPLLEASS